MKKSSHRDHAGEAGRQGQKSAPKSGGGWAFNLASESLFSLGSTEGSRRVAYRTSTGELRFLTL